MWIPKGAALIRGQRLFEARRLLDWNALFHVDKIVEKKIKLMNA